MTEGAAVSRGRLRGGARPAGRADLGRVRIRPLVAASIAAAACWALVPPVALGEEPTAGETLPTPFTAEQIRDAFADGLEVDIRMWSPEGETHQRWRIVATTPETCTMESGPVDAEGRPTAEPETGTTAWTELRDHAKFPADRATRERVERDSPLGRFEGWLYTVESAEGATNRFFFADALPGAPLWMQTTSGGEPVFVMEQIRRERASATARGDG